MAIKSMHPKRQRNYSEEAQLDLIAKFMIGQAEKWEQALCAHSADPDAWFLESGQMTREDIDRVAYALDTCDLCPIKNMCLEQGLVPMETEWGIRGGLFAIEREAMIRDISRNGTKIKKMSGAASIRNRVAVMKAKEKVRYGV